jgi:hypothetical protein
MNGFLSNQEKYCYDTFEYDGKIFVRECHGVVGVHWHPIRLDGGKSWELPDTETVKELEKQYIRAQKLTRVLKNDNE